MLPFPKLSNYRLDRETWDNKLDPDELDTYTKEQLNNHIALLMLWCKHYNYMDEDLWEEYWQSIEG